VGDTKQQALIKLQGMVNKIGYPDHWRYYSSVRIHRGENDERRRTGPGPTVSCARNSVSAAGAFSRDPQKHRRQDRRRYRGKLSESAATKGAVCSLQLELRPHHFIFQRMLQREAQLLEDPHDAAIVRQNIGHQFLEFLASAYEHHPREEFLA
jgi:hypothetical protein